MIDKKKAYRIIEEYFRDKPIKKIQVFGSFARNEQKGGSDIDIILELEKPVGLFKLSEYVLDLEEKLGINVDLGTDKSLSSYVRPYVERELETVYKK